MKAVLNQLDIISKDVLASVEFYRRCGVDIPERNVWLEDGKAHHVEAAATEGVHFAIDSEDMTRGYDAGWQASSDASRNYMIFSVPTREAVDELYADVTGAGYQGHLAPFDAFWGSRYAVVNDPDGNKVGFMSPQDPALHGAPPGL